MPAPAEFVTVNGPRTFVGDVPPVGVVCHFPPPPGGMQGQAQAYLDGLRAEGIEAIAIQTNLSAQGFGAILESLRYVRSGARFVLFLCRLLRALPRVGILHVMACCELSFFLFSAPAVILGRLFGRRVIVECLQDGRAREFFGAWPRFTFWIFRQAGRIQVESKYLQKIFHEELGLDAIVVRNICDLQRFSYRGGRPVRPRFLVARHLQPLYNVACVIRAFAIVKGLHGDAVLTVMGSGPEEENLRRLAAELEITDSVRFTGYIESGRMPEFYGDSSIALNASNADNSPNAILEAFAAGLPVITTRAGGIPYLVENGITGFLVDLNDHEAMAARALELLNNPELAQRLSTNARDAALRHTWPMVFPEVLNVYEEARGD